MKKSDLILIWGDYPVYVYLFYFSKQICETGNKASVPSFVKSISQSFELLQNWENDFNIWCFYQNIVYRLDNAYLALYYI